VQTIHAPAIAVALLLAIQPPTADAHQRPSETPTFTSIATPSGLAFSGYLNAPAFGDLDGDGDLDVVTGLQDGTFFYFENTGSATDPAFVTTTTLSGLFDIGSHSAPALGDLDGDGDLDLLAGSDCCAIRYFENTGSSSSPAFAAFTTLSGLSKPIYYVKPTLGDLDGDGDLDVLVGEFDKTFHYFENTGTASAPAFATTATLSGLSSNYTFTTPAFGDLDGDGDLDVLSGHSNDTFSYFENTGSSSSPAFAAGTTLNDMLGSGIYYGTPLLGDLDGDGDLDVLAGDGDGDFNYFEFDGSPSAPTFAVSTTLSGLSDIGSSSAPALGDLDGDGDLDMLTGGDADFEYFENTGTDTVPFFAAGVTLSGLTIFQKSNVSYKGTLATEDQEPALGDLDGDGDLDVLAGKYDGIFIYFENTGTALVPAFGLSTTLSGLTNISSHSTPALGDPDGDGDLDVLTGHNDGSFVYYENTGTPTAPAFATTTLSGLLDIGLASSPAFGDLDGDGDLDVLAGESLGDFFYFENTGTATAPAFVTSTTPGGLSDVGGQSALAYGDLDGDGDLDVLSGEGSGNFSYFENISRFVIPIIAEGDRLVVPVSKNGSPTSFSLTTNATDDLGHELTWSVRLNAGNGSEGGAIGTGGSKTLTYTPNNNFTGVDEFIVEVTNEHGYKDSITVIVRVLDTDNAIDLRDEFVNLDDDPMDNGLSLAEAQVEIPGLTQYEFDFIDTNGDGLLSIAELLQGTFGSGSLSTVYVNFANAGTENGTSPATGFNTLLEGASYVSNGGTIVISGDSSSETIYIPAPMTLQTGGGTITIGAP
jgi:hypothetical protein